MRWQLVDYYGTWLKLRQDLYFPRGIIHAIRWQPNDYYCTRPYEDTRLLIPKRNFSSMRQQFVDYYGTRLKLKQDLHFLKGTIRPRDDKQIDYYGTRRYNPRQSMTNFMKRQPTDRPSTKEKKYYTLECQKYSSGQASTQKPKEYYNNCSRLWRRLQATNNPISNGFHLRDILREFLLWTTNGHPITNRGQVCRGEKGFN